MKTHRDDESEGLPWWIDSNAALMAIILLALAESIFMGFARAESIPATGAFVSPWNGVTYTSPQNTANGVCAAASRGAGTICSAELGRFDCASTTHGGAPCVSGTYFSTYTGSYSCPSVTPPYTLNTSNSPPTCDRPDPCPSGVVLSEGLYDVGTNPDGVVSTGCSAGCKSSFSGSMLGRVLVGGVYHYIYKGNYTQIGEECTTGDAPPEVLTAEPDPTCAEGQTMGQINGKPQCFSSSTGDPVNPNTGAPAAGDTTTAYESLPGGGSRETTCKADGSCVEVDKNSEGKEVARRETGQDPLVKFCQENPSASVCSRSSFSGSCVSGFACEGDAAQCAAARAANEMACALKPDASKTVDTLLADLNLTDAASDFGSRKTTTDLSKALKFDERSISSRECPAPRVIETPLGNITLTFAPMCEFATIISVFLLMGSIVAAARIVVGG